MPSLPRPPAVRPGPPALRSPFLPASHRHGGNRRTPRPTK
ncbi:hypothetical protein SHJG_5636 [Streptomyces hygroscopicus subsp. jinggangensis 5008]|nr:hypothetical protein SHJG_5636 [Streptomyces hygroscopicus subsp. jinggangensis 5008]AGF65060.1 hypothetical protein SHJGH_5397 [Streptomyces hygroscopicus subsp. jinggangensis TL01]